MRRLPARYWRFTVQVRRADGEGGVGVILTASTRHLAMIQQETLMVRDDAGNETVSTTQVQLPAGVPPVPVDSEVTLPDQFGGSVTRVIKSKPRYFDGSTRLAYHALDCE